MQDKNLQAFESKQLSAVEVMRSGVNIGLKNDLL
jgi:hypothetical protein